MPVSSTVPSLNQPNNAGNAASNTKSPFWIARIFAWGYLGFAIAVVILIRAEGERWWIGTLILFGPRWIFGLPLLIVVPLMLLIHRRLVWVVAVSALIFTFPILGVCIPWRIWLTSTPSARPLRVITCNMHRQMLDTAAFASFMADSNPDIIVLQEYTARNQAALFSDPTWNLRRDGELMIASRYPIQRDVDIVQGRWGPEGAAVCYDILLPTGPIRLMNLHLASPHLEFAAALHREAEAPAAIESNCQTRREQSAQLAEYARSSQTPTLLAGDFNTPADSETFRKSWTGFTDAFNTAGTGIGNTYYAKWTSVRIDHILFSAGLRCRKCIVGPNVGSPHRPVLAEF